MKIQIIFVWGGAGGDASQPHNRRASDSSFDHIGTNNDRFDKFDTSAEVLSLQSDLRITLRLEALLLSQCLDMGSSLEGGGISSCRISLILHRWGSERFTVRHDVQEGGMYAADTLLLASVMGRLQTGLFISLYTTTANAEDELGFRSNFIILLP